MNKKKILAGALAFSLSAAPVASRAGSIDSSLVLPILETKDAQTAVADNHRYGKRMRELATAQATGFPGVAKEKKEEAKAEGFVEMGKVNRLQDRAVQALIDSTKVVWERLEQDAAAGRSKMTEEFTRMFEEMESDQAAARELIVPLLEVERALPAGDLPADRKAELSGAIRSYRNAVALSNQTRESARQAGLMMGAAGQKLAVLGQLVKAAEAKRLEIRARGYLIRSLRAVHVAEITVCSLTDCSKSDPSATLDDGVGPILLKAVGATPAGGDKAGGDKAGASYEEEIAWFEEHAGNRSGMN